MIYSQRRRLVAASRAQFMVFQHFKYHHLKKKPTKILHSDVSRFKRLLLTYLLTSRKIRGVNFFSVHPENHR